ncbi:MAG: threonylcarbamoyl-AMP synthase [Acidobacteria bacterium]|nr:threonylcarbamoyl-AMP synthase [Acidobacteriota bacterium]
MSPLSRQRTGGGDLEEAVAALEAGLVVLIPTDTVYGLAVDPRRPGATGRLFAIKERPTDAALPVLAADEASAFGLAATVPEPAARLARRFWPGGLTLVVPRRSGLALDLGGADDTTIGVRVPDHDLVRQLARRVGPLAATSANLHGRTTPPTAEEVMAQLGDAGVAVVLDGGRCEGAPSTVVACTDLDAVVLREGRIAAETIRDAVR